MPTIVGHMAVAAGASKLFENALYQKRRAGILKVALLLTILPDLDVLAFKFGIPYQSQWGHRGFTHSLGFSFALSLISYFIMRLYYSKKQKNVTPLSWWAMILFFCCLVSHVFLDMLTNGGLGCALYWPFLTERYFFWNRPIPVSPLAIRPSLVNVLLWEMVLLLPFLGFAYAIKSRLRRKLKLILAFLCIAILASGYTFALNY